MFRPLLEQGSAGQWVRGGLLLFRGEGPEAVPGQAALARRNAERASEPQGLLPFTR